MRLFTEDGRRRRLDEDENAGNTASEGTSGTGNFVIMGDHNIINYNTVNAGGSGGSPCTCLDGRSGYRLGGPSAREESNATIYSEQWMDEYSSNWFPHFSRGNCTYFGGAYCPTPAPTFDSSISAGYVSGKISSQLPEAANRCVFGQLCGEVYLVLLIFFLCT